MSQISPGDPTRNGFIGQSEPASTFRPPHVKFFKQRPPVEHRPLPARRHPAAEIRHVAWKRDARAVWIRELVHLEFASARTPRTVIIAMGASS